MQNRILRNENKIYKNASNGKGKWVGVGDNVGFFFREASTLYVEMPK